MASGHANRANRPNTWLHRPTPANVKILLALARNRTSCSLNGVHGLMDAFSGPASIAPKKSVKRVLRLHKLPEA